MGKYYKLNLWLLYNYKENIEFFSIGVYVFWSWFLEYNIEINNFNGDKSIILL